MRKLKMIFAGAVFLFYLSVSGKIDFNIIDAAKDAIKTVKDMKDSYDTIKSITDDMQSIESESYFEYVTDEEVVSFNYEDIKDNPSNDIEMNGGVPYFAKYENSNVVFTEYLPREPGLEIYSNLDSLGRVGSAYAYVGPETLPENGEERGDISSIKPTGWRQNKYDFVDQEWLYNRCHLIAWCLTAENANKKNLMTGTRSFNLNMLKYEKIILEDIKNSGSHVMVRVTPVFEGNNLLAEGVLYEALSIEDNGQMVCVCRFIRNAEPGVEINYATGENWTK